MENKLMYFYRMAEGEYYNLRSERSILHSLEENFYGNSNNCCSDLNNKEKLLVFDEKISEEESIVENSRDDDNAGNDNFVCDVKT